ncbi:MAG: hypothetical protein V3V01_17995 [Acidimicrobiales bacterium]
MGNPFGPAADGEYQKAILRTALELAESDINSGDIIDLKDAWPRDFTSDVEKELLSV